MRDIIKVFDRVIECVPLDNKLRNKFEQQREWLVKNVSYKAPELQHEVWRTMSYWLNGISELFDDNDKEWAEKTQRIWSDTEVT